MKTNTLSTSVKNANHIYATVRNTMLAAVLTLLGTGMAFADNTSTHTANYKLLLLTTQGLGLMVLVNGFAYALIGLSRKDTGKVVSGVFMMAISIAGLVTLY